jgi:hypothetical protein
MELPIVRATRPADLLMLDKPVPVDKPYGGIVAAHFPSQYSAVSAIYFRNDGRTPAFPLQMQVVYRRGDCRTQGGQAWLWRYCSLTYRDFIGIKEKRFCWRWAQRRPAMTSLWAC